MKTKKAKRKRKRIRNLKRKQRPILRGIGLVILEPFIYIKEKVDIIMRPLTTIETLRNLDEGDYPIEETVELPFTVGQKVCGIGAGQYIPPGKKYRGHTSNLLWEGTGANDPILKVTGVGASIEKTTFVDAPIGILLTHPKRGLGTGKMVVRDCYFDECATVFQAGLATEEHSNDNVLLEKVTADNAESLLVLKNSQAMGFSLRDCLARGDRTKDIIDVFAGGCVYADNLTVINGDCILRLRSRKEGGKNNIGSSNGLYTLRNIKLDQEAGTCKIVQMDDHYPVNIDVANVQAPFKKWIETINQGNPQLMYEIRGNSVLTVSGSDLYSQCIAWHEKKRKGDDDIPNILLNRCRFNTDKISEVLSKDKSSGKCYFTATHCTDRKGNPIPDMSAYVDA